MEAATSPPLMGSSSSSEGGGKRSRLDCLDGARALAHMSIILLHAAMLTTAHLAGEGPVWDGVRKNSSYSFAQAGGTQVDMMFVMSGFLLATQLVEKPMSLSTYVHRRAARLVPSIAAVALLGLALGDTWDVREEPPAVPAWKRILIQLALVNNYFPAAECGSFTLTLCWSCSVDFQVGAAVVIIVNLVRGPTAEATARRGRLVFGALVAASVAIRAVRFDPDRRSIVKLASYAHFGRLMTDASRGWVADYYNHTWRAEAVDQTFVQGYLDDMYLPTHTRFGPFCVGALLACNVTLAKRSALPATVLGRAGALAATLWALGTLVVPCLPASDDEVPEVGQLVATAALRTLSAAAFAILLYRCLVPPGHAWRLGALDWVLSQAVWKPLARLSFCSYLLHLRILMELNFREPLRRRILGNKPDPTDAPGWLRYIPRLALVGLVASLYASTLLHHLVERPAAKLLAPRGEAKETKPKRA